jgi:hypothetical protein
MFLIRGIVFSHGAVRAWAAKLTAALAEACGDADAARWVEGGMSTRPTSRSTGTGVISTAPLIARALADVMFSEHCDMATAKAFFESAKMVTGTVTLVRSERCWAQVCAIATASTASTASISITGWSKIIAVSKADTVRCAGSSAGDRLAGSAGATTSCVTSSVSRSRTNQHVSADYRMFHFLRRTSTVLRVLDAA